MRALSITINNTVYSNYYNVINAINTINNKKKTIHRGEFHKKQTGRSPITLFAINLIKKTIRKKNFANFHTKQ